MDLANFGFKIVEKRIWVVEAVGHLLQDKDVWLGDQVWDG